MAERKAFLNIQYISDDDCGMYKLGEIDTSSQEAVSSHIRSYGESGYESVKDFAPQLLFNAELSIRAHRNSANQAQTQAKI